MENHKNMDQPIAITLQELRFCRNKIVILCHVKQQLRHRIDSYRFQNQIIAIDNEITILKYKVVLLNKKLLSYYLNTLTISVYQFLNFICGYRHIFTSRLTNLRRVTTIMELIQQ
nr:hyp [Cotesia vestalis bracovirus]